MNEIDLRCFYCLLNGSHEPPPVLTWVNGTAVCAAHLHESQERAERT